MRPVLSAGCVRGRTAARRASFRIIAAVQLGLPSINEVPADVLWKFRVAAIGMQAIMWATIIGLLFGAWVERDERIGMRAA